MITPPIPGPAAHSPRLQPVWIRPAVMVCALFAIGCKKPAPLVVPPPVVQLMEIKTRELPLSTILIGQLDSPQNVEVRARVEGFVDKMLFTEGVEVKQGDVLFELDKKPYLEKLSGAQGALSEAEAALAKYRMDVERLLPLAKSRAIPQQDLDNAKASVEVGQAGVVSAKARLESAQLDLGYCDVRAPITGLIGAKQVSIGDLVGKGTPTLLATMSTLDPIWFYCNVSETDYIRAEKKSQASGREISKLPVKLILSNGEEQPDEGHFVFIDRAVDVKTGTLRIRAEFPNPKKLLRPGMFARVRVDLGTQAGVVVVPERALVQLQGRTFVWVVDQNAMATQRPVTLGEQVGGDFIIRDGLKEGERIVLEGVQKAREGAPVTILPASKGPAAEASKPGKE